MLRSCSCKEVFISLKIIVQLMLTLCGIFISESFAVSAGTLLVIKGNYG